MTKSTSTVESGDRFPTGTFSPAPQRASFAAMVKAQAKIETLLFLRHGEQQLLSLVIPIAMLIGLTLMPVLSIADPVARIFPMVLAVAILGAGFTGQAIAVAFDRRYGALKRLGAAGAPTSALIGGKIAAVGVVVAIQIITLGIVAVFLGWTPAIAGLPAVLVFAVLGIAAFTALGLWIGGTLSSEMVLAVANLAWFVLMGAAGYSSISEDLSSRAQHALDWIPSVALTEGLHAAFGGSFDWYAALVLVIWTAIGAACAKKYFTFTIKGD